MSEILDTMIIDAPLFSIRKNEKKSAWVEKR